MENSLRKFQSREKLFGGQDGCKMKVKLEDSYVLSVKEAQIVDGWKPPLGAQIVTEVLFKKGRRSQLVVMGNP